MTDYSIYSDDELRRALAEARGWRNLMKLNPDQLIGEQTGRYTLTFVPNWPGDVNAALSIACHTFNAWNINIDVEHGELTMNIADKLLTAELPLTSIKPVDQGVARAIVICLLHWLDAQGADHDH